HVHSTGDRDGLSSDVFSVVRGEHGNDPAIIFRLAHAAERDTPKHRVLPLHGLLALAKYTRHHRRVGRTGAYGVEQDVFARELTGQRFGEGNQSALAGGVDGLVAGPDARSVRSDIDDPSAAALSH